MIPLTSSVGCIGVAVKNDLSSRPTALGAPSGRDDRHRAGHDHPPRPSPSARHPKSLAAWATECSPGPIRRAISARARSVSTARGAISSECSDYVPAGHVGSAQRHSRLAHTSTTDAPRWASPAPRLCAGRARCCGHHRSHTSLGPRWSLPPATTHGSSRRAAGQSPQTPPSPTRADTPLPSRSIRCLLSMWPFEQPH
jgi:hypothetical protein